MWELSLSKAVEAVESSLRSPCCRVGRRVGADRQVAHMRNYVISQVSSSLFEFVLELALQQQEARCCTAGACKLVLGKKDERPAIYINSASEVITVITGIRRQSCTFGCVPAGQHQRADKYAASTDLAHWKNHARHTCGEAKG